VQDVAPLELLERHQLGGVDAGDGERRRRVRPHLLGQILGGDQLEARHRHRALDGVGQLAHVARPLVARQLLGRGRREPGDRLAEAPGGVVDEALREPQHVAPRARSGGMRDLDHVDPVVQVLAEVVPASSALEVAVGGGHQRPSNGTSSSPPTGRTRRSCRARSSLACSSSGISPISSRNSVPPLASHEQARPGAAGVGEGALDVAEQLALEQRLRQGRAVDRHERPGRALGEAGAARAPPAPCRCRSRR
jgi:hypothetical protein